MSDPLISIVVSVYNVANYIKRCLDSISKQTFKNFECIIVDDGSTDNSGRICDLYSLMDSRFIVYHQTNRGLSVARNNAISHARGRYLSFVDSDDFLMPTYLEQLYHLLIDNECDIAKCNYYRGEADVDSPEISVNVYSGNDFTRRVLCDEVGSQLWQYIYKIELWDGITSPEGRYAQDMMILHIVTNRARRVCVTSEKLYVYYIGRPDSTSNNLKKKVKGAFDRAIAFKIRSEFASNEYPYLVSKLLCKMLDFFNNGLVLMDKNDRRYNNDINAITLYLKCNRDKLTPNQVGLKYYMLCFLLSRFPYLYSSIRSKKL